MVIIGAGVAGLAAGRRLVEGGARVVILEARDRIGGRILTERAPGLAVPIELGAEFLHAEAEETREVARQAGMGVTDVRGRRMLSTNGRLHAIPDFEKRVNHVLGRLDPDADPDRSYAEAIRRTRLPAETRRLATRFVEGFHGADKTLVSERFLARSADDEEAMRIARVDGGYDKFVTALAEPIRPLIRLSSVVTSVSWQEGRVDVEARSSSGRRRLQVRSRAVIVTVPWGVLSAPAGQKGSIDFEPQLPIIDQYRDRLTMGTVMRVALQFDEPIWSTSRFAEIHGQKGLRQMTFIQSLAKVPFPVFWTTYPSEAPLLVAWSGGPEASEMKGRSKRRIVQAALSSLARVTGLSRSTIDRHLVNAFTHDWLRDPFTRGAYSYACIGGSQAGAVLARPIQHTVFIAGEHAIAGRNGTVDGAIASGQRAAEQILRA